MRTLADKSDEVEHQQKTIKRFRRATVAKYTDYLFKASEGTLTLDTALECGVKRLFETVA